MSSLALAHLSEYIPESCVGIPLFLERDIIGLKKLLYLDDPSLDEKIPCKVVYVNPDLTGKLSAMGLAVYDYQYEKDRSIALIQGEQYQLSLREIADILCSNSCSIELNLSHDSSMLMSQAISAKRYGTSVKTTQHSSISDYPIDRMSSTEKGYSAYQAIKREMNGRGVVQASVVVAPLVNHEAFDFISN